MAKKRKGGGLPGAGLGGSVLNLVWLLVIVGGIIGWARVNDINSIPAFVDYVKAWSDKAKDCYGTTGELKDMGCDANSGGVDVSPPGKGGGLEASPIKVKEDKQELLEALDKLKTAPADAAVKYDRKEWRHWTGSPCNAREATLKAQGKDVKTAAPCKIVSGVWIDPYSKVKIDNARGIDIDHVIPLGYVAKHGGQAWSSSKKEQYANDPLILVATSAKENRSKSDKGPSKYMPPNREFHCAYSALWVQGATKYGIWIEAADRKALKAGLESCK